MRDTAPYGFLYVRGQSATTHLTGFVLGAPYAPALCGERPGPAWNPDSRQFDGPTRWSEIGQVRTGGNDCPRCAEEVARVATR